MRNLILTAVSIVTTVFLSICPCVPSALALTPVSSVLLPPETQSDPTPSPAPLDPLTTSSPTDASLTAPTLSSSELSFTSLDLDKILRPPAPAQNVNWSNLVLLVTPVVTSSLLMAMVLYVSLYQPNPTAQDDPDTDGLKEKGEFIAKSFPPVIEGITVYLIVAVVAVLSLSAAIRPEGTVGIISGISGYVLGKQSSRGSKSQGE